MLSILGWRGDMKHLLLLRHAKSDWDNPKLDDYDRPLTARGELEAPLIGKELKKHKLQPDLIFSSGALRARQTIEVVIKSGKLNAQPQFKDSLYGASWEELLSHVRALPESSSCVLLCGHNPGMEELLHRLTGANQRMTTACLASIDLQCKHWAEAADNQGELKWLISGKQVDSEFE